MILRTEQEIINTWAENKKPLVSICCVTYNHEKYITEALDGFLMQETDFPFEIIIRDDCSTDKTAEIIRQYVSLYPTIIKPIYEQTNQFSKGIFPFPPVMKQSLGKYIAICEGDDYWTTATKLQQQIDFLEQNPDYSLIFQNALIQEYDKNGVIIETRPHTTLDSGEVTVAQILMTKIVPTASVVVKNVDFNDYYSKTYPVGDTPLFMYMAKFGRLYYHSDITSVYRILTTGMANSLGSLKYQIAFISYYRDLHNDFREFAIDKIIQMLLVKRYTILIITALKEKRFGYFIQYLAQFFFLYPLDFFKVSIEEIKLLYSKKQ